MIMMMMKKMIRPIRPTGSVLSITALLIAMILAPPGAAFGGDTAVNTIDTLVDTSSGASLKTARNIRQIQNINTVVVIPVTGAVDHGLAAFIGRGIAEARHYDNALVVLDIDTYGGQVDAAFNIVDSVTGSGMPTAAFVSSKAISAGALIALSADQMFMRPNTTIGDVAPLVNTNEGPKMLGEKFQSPLRAKFRSLAARNGYPEILAEAMVTEEIAVFEITTPDTVMYLDSAKTAELDARVKDKIISQKLAVRAGELLTMTNEEAARFGFSKKTVADFDEMLAELNCPGAKIIVIGKNWSERFVSLLAALAPILMMIGLSSLYIEMRSPGFGVPGAIGVVCLALVFFGQHAVGLASYTELLLLILGGMLLAAEVFIIPGFGVAGVLGLGLIMAGMVLSFQDFVIPSPELPWQADILRANVMRLSVSVIGAILLIFLFFKYGLERVSRVIKGPYLAATLADAQSDEGMSFVPKVGDKGIASTSLRPSGKVMIGKNLCDVVTDGQFIDEGAELEVIEIHGNRIVVAAR